MTDKYKYNLRTFIIFGVLFELMNVFYNPYVMKFLERIGGTEFHFSLMDCYEKVGHIGTT